MRRLSPLLFQVVLSALAAVSARPRPLARRRRPLATAGAAPVAAARPRSPVAPVAPAPGAVGAAVAAALAPAAPTPAAGRRPLGRLGRRTRFGGRARPTWLADRTALAAAVAIGAVFTGWNMFRYPRYELDEGTYIGSAWAMLDQGRLSYYTYNYDHPPLGWLILGLWAKLLGGFRVFGMSINVGRVLMLVVTLLTAATVFALVRMATGRTAAALLGAVAFVVSPLGVPLHRQIYLDNIGTLFLLISLSLIVASGQQLGRVVLSAIVFGLAFWTKEIFVVALPAMLYLVVARAHPRQRAFFGTLWLSTAGSAISAFVLLALLKDELLPPGTLWSSTDPHVSLIETYLAQASREGGGFLSGEGGFGAFARDWAARDPLIIGGGIVAAIGLALWRRRDHLATGLALLIGSFVLFLGRGGIVLDYYVIPLVALLAVALGIVAGHALNAAARWQPGRRFGAAIAVALTVLLVGGSARANRPAFTVDQTTAQTEAARWVAANLPSDSLIIMDSYPWVDLRDPTFTGGRTFRAHYYWPALNDPTLRRRLTENRWQTIDYVVTSPSLFSSEARSDIDLLREVVENSDIVRRVAAPGAGMEIRRVRKVHRLPATANPMLTNTWQTYKERFIADGRVLDPKSNNETTSEGQAYAMIQAVYMDDPGTFDRVWAWTKNNLQTRGDGLLSWRWGERPDGTFGVLDPNSATDADEDAALALLFASKVWDRPAFQREALAIVADIWDQETATIAGRRTVVAGNWARGDQRADRLAVVNPSYFAPYAYRIFDQVDPDPSHDWESLVHSSYDLLARIQNIPELGGEVGLVPDWLVLDVESGEFGDAERLVPRANEFSYDASRYSWRMALDWLWFRDGRAEAALRDLAFPRTKYEEEGRLFAAYHMDGSPAADYESLSLYAGVVPSALIAGETATAHRMYAERVLAAYVNAPDGAYWGDDPTNYYNQNMAWFAVAVVDGAMGNLWDGKRTIQWGPEETG